MFYYYCISHWLWQSQGWRNNSKSVIQVLFLLCFVWKHFGRKFLRGQQRKVTGDSWWISADWKIEAKNVVSSLATWEDRMYMSARMSGGAQSLRPPLRHSTPPHSAIVLEQHRDTPWSCPSYPHLLIILSYSSCPYLFDLLIFATFDCQNVCHHIFPRLGVSSTPYFWIVHFLLSKPLDILVDWSIKKEIMHKT